MLSSNVNNYTFCNCPNLCQSFVVKADRALWCNHIIKIETKLFKRKIESCNLKLAKYFSKRNKKMYSKQWRHIYCKFQWGPIFSVFSKKALLISPNTVFSTKVNFYLRTSICLSHNQQYIQNLHHTRRGFILVGTLWNIVKIASIKKSIETTQLWLWIMYAHKYVLSSSTETLRRDIYHY